MKRTVLLLIALLLIPPGTGNARERERNQRPRADLTAVVAEAGRGTSVEYLLTVDAVDPDGQITEIVVDFGDGAMVFLLLACDPDAPPGTPAKQEMTWSYAPGQYTARAWAYSSPDCFSGPFQQSRADVEPITVG
jgi:hypothetical protein